MMQQDMWNYILVGVCSLVIGVFSLEFAREKVQKAELTEEEIITLKNGKIPELTRTKQCMYSLIHLGLWILFQYRFGLNWEFLIMGLAISCLVGLSAVDFEAYEIPPEYNVIILILGVLHTVLDFSNWLEYCIGFFAVSIILLIVALVTKGNGMGGGDIKLMATLGLLVGWKKIILALILGSVIGALFHGIMMLVFRKKNVLAFGPYLSMGTIICMCYGKQIIEWYLRTFFSFLK